MWGGLAHVEREVGLRIFNEEIRVSVYQAVDRTVPDTAVEDVDEQREPRTSVLVIHHEVLSGIAAAGHIIDGTGEFKTEWAGQAGSQAALNVYARSAPHCMFV